MSLFCRIFHRKRTSPRRDEEGSYVRCTECGTRLPWQWKDKTPVGHTLTQLGYVTEAQKREYDASQQKIETGLERVAREHEMREMGIEP